MKKRKDDYTRFVNYADLDPYKRHAQIEAALTDECLPEGYSVIGWSRGESAFLLQTPFAILAFVVEGVGTKPLAADKAARHIETFGGRTFYREAGICNAAMAFNDLITLGAQPLIYGQYLAVRSGTWFNNKKRSADLARGTREACQLAGCAWGGGETPALRGIICRGTADLAGATVGIITNPKHLINPENIAMGDAIVFIESSGIHANYLSKARDIATKLPKGYLTRLSDGKTYGETLLTPTHIYVRFVMACLAAGIPINYTVNITGHGWRKLMRANEPFTYVVKKLPTEQPIFSFIQKHGNVSDYNAYANMNMGAGFALYVPQSYVRQVCSIAWTHHFNAFQAGHIEAGPKRVVIRPKNIVFKAESLQVR